MHTFKFLRVEDIYLKQIDTHFTKFIFKLLDLDLTNFINWFSNYYHLKIKPSYIEKQWHFFIIYGRHWNKLIIISYPNMILQ